MSKLPIWQKDWFLGLIVVLFFLVFAKSDLIQSLERKAYDLGVLASSRIPSDKIAVISIDEQSIANLGRWPWPRVIHAKMIDLLAAGHAKVIGYTVFFFEPQVDPGLDYLYKIAKYISTSSPDSVNKAERSKLRSLLKEAVTNLDNDHKLSNSIARANDVLLAMFFELGESQGKIDQSLPDFVLQNNLQDVKDPGSTGELPLQSQGVLTPIPMLGSKAMAIGHMNNAQDVDGAIRTEPLVIGYNDKYYPSLSLMLAAKSLNLDTKDIHVNLGESVQLGKQFISTDPQLKMYTYYYKDKNGHPAFPTDSFYDVLTGKIPAEKYRDKIVIIGATAAGVGSLQVTPVSSMHPGEILANSVSSILKGDFFVSPGWAKWAQLGVFLSVALYLILVLPRLTAATGAIVTAVLFSVLLTTHFVLMTTQAVWLQLMLSTTLLLVGHLLLTTKRFLMTEKGKQKSDAESSESNRMLGLAFQGHGQLDLAFDKFRKVPMDDGLMDVLYNLGLDFERKRQFNKAESVFKYMAAYDPKFRDLAHRLTTTKAMSEMVMLGGASGKHNTGALLLEKGGVSKPKLGRYEIEKEIGKGAMGAVYLGKDPKIGRVVAIKTMALAQEFGEDELADVTARFFREAEAAGRLNHPNIVAIYDAGEEQDLAYIAMEFLKGRDLVPYTNPENLLPLDKVMGIIARVADALDYAHKQKVVHRDIKPANIMYDPITDITKVTDFGIARIIDVSSTKTGKVFGTPSFMSPEQLLGQKLGSASDLFSLGVTLYQLACGKLPFEGDSMGQLVNLIINQPHADILSIRPDLPQCLVAIINRSLAKIIDDRYPNGAEMAKAIRKCAATFQQSSLEDHGTN
jgi:serine/threonine-protein kinase